MTVNEYVGTVTDRLESNGYEEVTDLPDDVTFNRVYAQRVKSVRFGGLAHKFIAIADGEIDKVFARDAAEDLRAIMTDESLNVLGFGENMVGYVVLPQQNLDGEVRVFINAEYENQKGTAFVFPIGVDLDSGDVITHPVPRLKGRTAYKAQEKDAEKYFTP